MEQLTAYLKKIGVLKTKTIISAFRAIDRADFVIPDYKHLAYGDEPLPTQQEQTISQPTVVAFMLELLEPQHGERILDVGSGSGWTTALLANIVGTKGKVYGVEIVPELTSYGQKNIAKYNFQNAKITQAKKTFGLQEYAPFDKILVSASGSSIPQSLLDQLTIGGVMVIPIDDAIWKVRKKTRLETDIEKFEGFLFVPLLKNT